MSSVPKATKEFGCVSAKCRRNATSWKTPMHTRSVTDSCHGRAFLVIPKHHVANYFGRTPHELSACDELIRRLH